MINEPDIKGAIKFATDKHRMQMRKYMEVAYINHPLSVYHRLKEFLPHNKENREEMLITAILHDTLEDTETTQTEITALFGKVVGDMVYGLTKDNSGGTRKQRNAEYLAKLKALTQDTMIIKVFDIEDNLADVNSRICAVKQIPLISKTKPTKKELAFYVLYLTEKLEQLTELLTQFKDKQYITKTNQVIKVCKTLTINTQEAIDGK